MTAERPVPSGIRYFGTLGVNIPTAKGWSPGDYFCMVCNKKALVYEDSKGARIDHEDSTPICLPFSFDI